MAQDELDTLLNHDAVKGKNPPILFLANKVCSLAQGALGRRRGRLVAAS